VSWAAASVWAPMVQDAIKRRAPDHCRTKWDEVEDDTRRHAYFHEVFDKVVLPILIPHTQPSMWYRAGWEPHKARHIQASRRDRHEVYNAFFRRWHWRVAGEQLIYSHLDRVDHQSPTSPRRHALNRARHLLVAGEEDDFLARTSTPRPATRVADGRHARRSLFVRRTGHSMHAERPGFLAGRSRASSPRKARAEAARGARASGRAEAGAPEGRDDHREERAADEAADVRAEGDVAARAAEEVARVEGEADEGDEAEARGGDGAVERPHVGVRHLPAETKTKYAPCRLAIAPEAPIIGTSEPGVVRT